MVGYVSSMGRVCCIPAISPNPDGAVTIPSSLGGKPVTCIGEYSFFDCSGLTSLTIPDTVTSIEPFAFSGPPFSLGCSLPIFDTATIPGVKLVDGWAIGYTDEFSGTLELTGVRGIGDTAFIRCANLTSVTIGNGITSIANNAFFGCTNLTSVTTGNSITSIVHSAFFGCSNLTSVTMLGDVPDVGHDVYTDCPDDLITYVTSAWTGPTNMWQGRAVKVVADAEVTVDGNPVLVPSSWMLKYYAATAVVDDCANDILSRTAANGRRTVGSCYALGINPKDAKDDFTITSFEIVDGEPVFEFSHTEDGRGVSFEPRITKLGKAELGDIWQKVPPGGNPSFRFFKVEVELP